MESDFVHAEVKLLVIAQVLQPACDGLGAKDEECRCLEQTGEMSIPCSCCSVFVLTPGPDSRQQSQECTDVHDCAAMATTCGSKSDLYTLQGSKPRV